jgi:hypothetical protein
MQMWQLRKGVLDVLFRMFVLPARHCADMAKQFCTDGTRTTTVALRKLRTAINVRRCDLGRFMSQNPEVWNTLIKQGGRLEFILYASSESGLSRPLIVRRHLQGGGTQKIKTEQHVLVRSVEELDAWFHADPFNAECETSFQQIRCACIGILKRRNDD